ncbi:glycosyltransferase, family 8 [Trichuris suis]|nr:glycosyltransferase, family 8 [Trichuris suis]
MLPGILTTYAILIACITPCLTGSTASYDCPFGKIQLDKTFNQHNYKCFDETVHLAVVVCKERYDEALTMIKSAIMFGVSPMQLHIFTDETRKEYIRNEVEGYIRASAWRQLKMNIYRIQYPKGQEKLWAELFKPCSSQRLFIPDILTNVDAVLYVDIDVIFLRPIEDIWQLFKRFTAKQMIGVAPESEEKATNWYAKFAMHPFLKPYGLNTGVMLMNLTRMRAFSWSSHMYPLLEKYKYNITWGDQDLINILFSENEDGVLLFTCDWNYRPDHCMYTQLCKSADEKGISILHGSRSYFKLDKQPIFKLTYEIIKNSSLEGDHMTNVWLPLHKNLSGIRYTECAAISHMIEKSVKRAVMVTKYCISRRSDCKITLPNDGPKSSF